jgi:hypothetical protein
MFKVAYNLIISGDVPSLLSLHIRCQFAWEQNFFPGWQRVFAMIIKVPRSPHACVIRTHLPSLGIVGDQKGVCMLQDMETGPISL